jgi:hypothetical protein
VDEQTWRAQQAARLRRTLADERVRGELLGLLGMDDDGRTRQRRLDAARVELAGLELRYRIGEDEQGWEA